FERIAARGEQELLLAAELRIAHERAVERENRIDHRVEHGEGLRGTQARTPGAAIERLGAGTGPRSHEHCEDHGKAAVHVWCRDWGVNGCGSRSASDQRASASDVVRLVTTSSGANSTSTWRQKPHGGEGSSASVTSTRCANSRCPSEIAAATAARSAQIPAGYEEFSTLHPAITVPSGVSSAAPTRKPEYGAYARAIACSAALRIRASSNGRLVIAAPSAAGTTFRRPGTPIPSSRPRSRRDRRTTRAA